MWSPMKDPNSNQTIPGTAAKQRYPNRSNAGVHPVNETSCCDCCGVNQSRPSRARSRSNPTDWPERALAALDAGLKDRAEDDPVQSGLGAPYKRFGELGIENELLREKIARLEISWTRSRA
jgi:hypothetical protein